MRSARQMIAYHAFELGVLVAQFIIAVAWLANPGTSALHSPIHQVVTPWSYVWSAVAVVGAPVAVYGLAKHQTGLRVAGLILLGTALLMEFIVAVSVSGSDVRALIYLVYAGAIGSRASWLWVKVRSVP